jgi:hypothetical protein
MKESIPAVQDDNGDNQRRGPKPPAKSLLHQSTSETSEGGENEMKIMQKIMIAAALLGSFALATPAQAGDYWGCHRYHHRHHWCHHHHHHHW